jgi:rhamnogalacturonyl hydrolase YesR
MNIRRMQKTPFRRMALAFAPLLGALLPIAACKVRQPAPSADGGIPAAMVKAMRWQEAHPIQAKSPTDWTNGAYYVGVTRAHLSTRDTAFLHALQAMAQRNRWQPWNRYYHADDLIITYSYMHLRELGLPSDLAPADSILREHLHRPHEWRAGTAADEKKILWWWCDALFMAPPVLARHARMTKEPAFLDGMDRYYRQTYEMLYDREERLFYRDGRFLWAGQPTDRKEANGSKVFWARGNGWVLAGLALLLEEMPEGDARRPFYLGLYRDMADRVRALQPADGLWRTSLLHPGSFAHGEASGSGFFTFALAWGVNRGVLPRSEYAPAVRRAWAALAACQQPDGRVGWVQNIGYDPKPATAESWQNFGTGAFLMAGSEVLRMR